jgi:hypothetical protein
VLRVETYPGTERVDRVDYCYPLVLSAVVDDVEAVDRK